MNTTALWTWFVMVLLPHINPPGKFESTIGALKMHFVHNANVLIVTPDIQLGGAFAAVVRGPTPANLVPPGMVPAPAIPAIVPVRPRHTHPSVAAGIAGNWRV